MLTAADIGTSAPWRFTTKTNPPPEGAAVLTVAADGTGGFSTVQGALDFLPDGNRTARQIRLRPGTYTEIVAFANKHEITLLGDDRHLSILAYPNNARFNDGGGNYDLQLTSEGTGITGNVWDSHGFDSWTPTLPPQWTATSFSAD